jgi:phosphoglycolate phosphatase-like HAD superfamily hydrolase
LPKMSIQAVVFDRDGTLFDTRVRNIFGQLCRRYLLKLEQLHINPFPMVEEILEYLSSMNLDLALISSGTGTTATFNILQSLGLDLFFKSIVTMDDYGSPIPLIVIMRRIFRRFNEAFKEWQITETLKRLNVLPSQTLVVGDSVLDVVAGKKVGTKTIFVTKGSNKHQKQINELKPDAIIQNIMQLPITIEKILTSR